MGKLASLWRISSDIITGVLVGTTISDRYGGILVVEGTSMQPTLNPGPKYFDSKEKRDIVLLEKTCLRNYGFSHGDVIVLSSPTEHGQKLIKRVIGLPGDWIRNPETHDLLRVPEGRCWVEGDNKECSYDSRSFGPIPIGLIQGRATYIIWPPENFGSLDKRYPEGCHVLS